MERILRIKDVCQNRLTEIDNLCKNKTRHFPSTAKLVARSSGWKESELDLWIEQIQSARPE